MKTSKSLLIALLFADEAQSVRLLNQHKASGQFVDAPQVNIIYSQAQARAMAQVKGDPLADLGLLAPPPSAKKDPLAELGLLGPPPQAEKDPLAELGIPSADGIGARSKESKAKADALAAELGLGDGAVNSGDGAPDDSGVECIPALGPCPPPGSKASSKAADQATAKAAEADSGIACIPALGPCPPPGSKATDQATAKAAEADSDIPCVPALGPCPDPLTAELKGPSQGGNPIAELGMSGTDSKGTSDVNKPQKELVAAVEAQKKAAKLAKLKAIADAKAAKEAAEAAKAEAEKLAKQKAEALKEREEAEAKAEAAKEEAAAKALAAKKSADKKAAEEAKKAEEAAKAAAKLAAEKAEKAEKARADHLSAEEKEAAAKAAKIEATDGAIIADQDEHKAHENQGKLVKRAWNASQFKRQLAQDKARFAAEAKLRDEYTAEFDKVFELQKDELKDDSKKAKEKALKQEIEAKKRYQEGLANMANAEEEERQRELKDKKDSLEWNKRLRATVDATVDGDMKAMYAAQNNIANKRAIQKIHTSDAEYWTANMPEHIVNHYDGWDLIPKGVRITNADKFPDLIKSINPDDKPLNDGLTEEKKDGEPQAVNNSDKEPEPEGPTKIVAAADNQTPPAAAAAAPVDAKAPAAPADAKATAAPETPKE